MKKIFIILVLVIFISGCVDNDIKGDVTVDDEGITIDPEPVTIKKDTIIDAASDFISGLLESKDNSAAEQASD